MSWHDFVDDYSAMRRRTSELNYKGYTIEHGKGYYIVTGPEGTWSEDTVEDAKATIDSIEIEEEQNAVTSD